MGTAKEVVKQAYDAFGRGDVPAILALCAPTVDWELVGPAKLGYAGSLSLGSWVPDDADRRRILVDNPDGLFDF